MYSLKSSHRGDFNDYTQHTITLQKVGKDIPKLSLFDSSTGFMINPQWLELPMSKINFHGPKDVRVFEINCLYK